MQTLKKPKLAKKFKTDVKSIIENHINFLAFCEQTRKAACTPKYAINSITDSLAQKYNAIHYRGFWVSNYHVPTKERGLPSNVDAVIDEIEQSNPKNNA